MAPSWIVKDSAGPEIFQPVKSLPLKREVKPGSTGAACCKPAASIRGSRSVKVRMGAESTTGLDGDAQGRPILMATPASTDGVADLRRISVRHRLSAYWRGRRARRVSP